MSSTYFRKGMRYSTDSLSIERNRITNVLRDQVTISSVPSI